MEIFLPADEPTDPRERANWLPAPNGRFYMLIRHYSPKALILTGDWLSPPVMSVDMIRRMVHARQKGSQ